jgi:hypothetical protein
MTARKGTRKAEAVAPTTASAEGPDTDKPVELSKAVTGDEAAPDAAVRFAPARPLSSVHEVVISDVPTPTPPHPVKRYRVSPASHLGTRAGGYVLTERGWVPAAAPEQES